MSGREKGAKKQTKSSDIIVGTRMIASRMRAERSRGGLLTPEVINKSVSSRTPRMSRAELVHPSPFVNQC